MAGGAGKNRGGRPPGQPQPHPPHRYSSPSRPNKSSKHVPSSIRTFAVASSISTLLQGLAWVAMSLAAVLAYTEFIPVPRDNGWSDYLQLLTNLYFTENLSVPELPPDGLVSPFIMWILMLVTLVVNAAWVVASIAMFMAVRLGSRSAGRQAVLAWAVCSLIVLVADVVLAAAAARDLVVLLQWPKLSEYPSGDLTLVMCPGAILILALRGGGVLLANLVCVVVLLRRLSRMSEDPVLLESDQDQAGGPIDAFLYKNADRDSFGIHNPIFIPDDDLIHEHGARTTFKPASYDGEGRSGAGYHQGPGNGASRHTRQHLRDHLATDADDVSHLSWMEEAPDRYADVRVRSGTRPSAPPHHRFGYVAPPGAPDGHAIGLQQRPTSMLPRVRVNPDAPVFPYIPRPDYSPPPRRATGKAGSRSALERF